MALCRNLAPESLAVPALLLIDWPPGVPLWSPPSWALAAARSCLGRSFKSKEVHLMKGGRALDSLPAIKEILFAHEKT